MIMRILLYLFLILFFNFSYSQKTSHEEKYYNDVIISKEINELLILKYNEIKKEIKSVKDTIKNISFKEKYLNEQISVINNDIYKIKTFLIILYIVLIMIFLNKLINKNNHIF